MNSLIPWVGGKAKLLWIIDQLAPAHYTGFVNVFGGSGTVTLNRPRHPGCVQVYNDFNRDLCNLLFCAKEKTLPLIRELDFLPSRSTGYAPCICGKKCDIACYKHIMGVTEL